MSNHEARRRAETAALREFTDGPEQHRAFGAPWEGAGKGLGGELLMADAIDGALKTCARQLGHCSSAMFLSLDLGKKGVPHPALRGSDTEDLLGFGGDIDLALFVRESVKSPVHRYGNGGFRRLEQDHLILIDSKQYNRKWDMKEQFAHKVELVKWMRKALSANMMLGKGSRQPLLRISYHFAMTGDHPTPAWMSRVGSGIEGAERPTPVGTETQWWNNPNDVVMLAPAEVVIGQASMLILNNNQDNFRIAVPRALWRLVSSKNQKPYSFPTPERPKWVGPFRKKHKPKPRPAPAPLDDVDLEAYMQEYHHLEDHEGEQRR